jgi:hypothetical protein
MALPPAGYPKIAGRACGENWDQTIAVNGKIPKTNYGSQFRDTVRPIATDKFYVTEGSFGRDREAQQSLAAQIDQRIIELQSELPDSELTFKERQSIQWLLTRARAYLREANQIWKDWLERPGGAWPLDLDYQEFAGGVCTLDDRGSWKEAGGPRGGISVWCPDGNEIMDHAADRFRIGALFSDALAHVYCAEYGLKRLRLYKEAVAAYASRPGSGIGGFQQTPGAAGLDLSQIQGVLLGEGIDPCKDLGINCPEGEEPEGCPSGFCMDPEGLPDPGIPDEPTGVPLDQAPTAPAPAPSSPLRKPSTWFVAGAGTLVMTGIVYAVASR